MLHVPHKPTQNVSLVLITMLHLSLFCRGFPVEHYADNRPGLVVAFWGLALVLGRVLISQTDKKSDGTVFGSILNHVTVGRFANGASLAVHNVRPTSKISIISGLCMHRSVAAALLDRAPGTTKST